LVLITVIKDYDDLWEELIVLRVLWCSSGAQARRLMSAIGIVFCIR